MEQGKQTIDFFELFLLFLRDHLESIKSPLHRQPKRVGSNTFYNDINLNFQALF